MADEPVTPDPEQAPEKEEARPEDNLRGELERRTQKQRQAEKRAQELEERLSQLEDRDKTELERVRDMTIRLEQQLAQERQEKTAHAERLLDPVRGEQQRTSMTPRTRSVSSGTSSRGSRTSATPNAPSSGSRTRRSTW